MKICCIGVFLFLAMFFMSPVMAETVSIPSRTSHEECLDMMAGQILSYRFSASGRLDFNIHYHDDGEKTIYLAEDHSITEKEGHITVPVTQHYCLMWGNSKRQDRILDYFFEIKVDSYR